MPEGDDPIEAAKKKLEEAKKDFTPEMRTVVQDKRIESAITDAGEDTYGYGKTRRMKSRT